MADPDAAVPLLDRARRAAGITLSLDDFGTGYSSLAYLQRLPVQEVKIDRSFVQGLSPDAERSAASVLVRSIVGLGAAFGLHVVAEGVEDAAVLARLTRLGCDIAQGYHLSRPVPGDALPECGPTARPDAARTGRAARRQDLSGRVGPGPPARTTGPFDPWSGRAGRERLGEAPRPARTSRRLPVPTVPSPRWGPYPTGSTRPRSAVPRPRSEPRLDLHNTAVDQDLAREGRCGQVHLPTGGTCPLPARHRGSCSFAR